jgi:hypothetical protein
MAACVAAWLTAMAVAAAKSSTSAPTQPEPFAVPPHSSARLMDRSLLADVGSAIGLHFSGLFDEYQARALEGRRELGQVARLVETGAATASSSGFRA